LDKRHGEAEAVLSLLLKTPGVDVAVDIGLFVFRTLKLCFINDNDYSRKLLLKRMGDCD